MFLPCPLCDSVYNDVSVVSCATNMEMKTEEHIRTVQCMYVYIIRSLVPFSSLVLHTSFMYRTTLTYTCSPKLDFICIHASGC